MLLELARLDDDDLAALFSAVTEAAAILNRVARASIWRLEPDRSAITCMDNYLAKEGRHESGLVLTAEQHPTYVGQLAHNLLIRAHDARHDWRTRELAPGYLDRLGITSMLDIPIWRRGRVYGVLCCEHVGRRRRWTSEEERVASQLSSRVGRAVEAAARRSLELRWHTMLEALPEPVFLLDRFGNVVDSNSSARRLLETEGGITIQERDSQVMYRDLAGNPLPRDRWPGFRALRGEEVNNEIFEVISKRTQRRRFFRVTSATVGVPDAVEGAVVVYGDVTDEVQLERVKRDFLSALAHELRTPTTVVKGHAQLLARREKGSSDTQKAAGAIERAAERMSHIIEDIVDVSAITLGRLILVREELDIGLLVEQVAERSPHPGHPVRVTRSGPAPVVADRARFEQLFGRLFDNAVRYSPSGTEIVVNVDADANYVTISIADEGIGIPIDQQPHVFSAFSRAHAGTAYDSGGLGVALFLAREVVSRHGGSIWFESNEGQGTTFFVRLPRSREGAANEP